MRALIRLDEVLLENDWPEYIERDTGMPLTNPVWAGGPYVLLENYIPPTEESAETVVSISDAERAAEIAELKARLAARENDL